MDDYSFYKKRGNRSRKSINQLNRTEDGTRPCKRVKYENLSENYQGGTVERSGEGRLGWEIHSQGPTGPMTGVLGNSVRFRTTILSREDLQVRFCPVSSRLNS